MYGYLYKYLVLNKKLSLPGIGLFKIDVVPSRVDFVSKKIHPFFPVIRFMQGTVTADKYFYHFIAKTLNIDELEAIQKFNEFTFAVKEQFTLNGFVDFPGIGRITKQFSNTYSFKAENAIQPFYPDVYAERVVRKNAGHFIKVGEEQVHSLDEPPAEEQIKEEEKAWQVYALVLGLVGILAIAYYYIAK